MRAVRPDILCVGSGAPRLPNLSCLVTPGLAGELQRELGVAPRVLEHAARAVEPRASETVASAPDSRGSGSRRTMPAMSSTTGTWHDLVVETAGDAMRVTLDGKPAGYLKSSGIGHATKSKIELGVAGQDGYFDDIKVWNAEPAK